MSIQTNFNRYANSYDKHAILQQEVAKRLFTRLDIINPKSKKVLELGAGTGLLTKELLTKYNSNDILASDFAPNSLALNPAPHKEIIDAHHIHTKQKFDIIISNLMMQWCNLEQVIEQIQQVANNDALVIFSTFGPLTLNELKTSWAKVDNFKHINNFMDMHNIADKMLSLGVSGVIAESEIITLTYEKVMDILYDLKYIGASQVDACPTTKSKLQQMMNNYENFRKNSKLPVSYEVVYLHGWIIKDKTQIKLDNS
jgi:malonyl-CoA O-methyltransferase